MEAMKRQQNQIFSSFLGGAGIFCFLFAFFKNFSLGLFLLYPKEWGAMFFFATFFIASLLRKKQPSLPWGWFFSLFLATGAFLFASLNWLRALQAFNHEGMEKLSSIFWGFQLSFVFFVAFWLQQTSQDPTPTFLKKWVFSFFIPGFLGLALVYSWQVLTQGFSVPNIILPSPFSIVKIFFSSSDLLWKDFQQTFLKSALVGFVLGSGGGLFFSFFLDRSAMPIVGIAPIMVMWFGFDWQSKAAVVFFMTFFPMVVSCLGGLQQTNALDLDLLKTYHPSPWAIFTKVKIKQALPFIFEALKMNSLLAMIGAIVAEFFGSPIVGIGFRISTEVGRMNLPFVWASIVVSAVAGLLFYGFFVILDRRINFWHRGLSKKN